MAVRTRKLESETGVPVITVAVISESGSRRARPKQPRDLQGQKPNAPGSEALYRGSLLGSLLLLRPGDSVVTSPT